MLTFAYLPTAMLSLICLLLLLGTGREAIAQSSGVIAGSSSSESLGAGQKTTNEISIHPIVLNGKNIHSVTTSINSGQPSHAIVNTNNMIIVAPTHTEAITRTSMPRIGTVGKNFSPVVFGQRQKSLPFDKFQRFGRVRSPRQFPGFTSPTFFKHPTNR